nr:hypothetical protein BaRGS_005478 [Batillaria attramentaria]
MQVQVENPGTGAFADAGATPINLGAKLRLYFFMEDNLSSPFQLLTERAKLIRCALTVFRGKRSVDSENRVLTTSIRVVTSAVHSNSSKGGSASDVTGDKSDCLEDSRTQTIIAVLGVAVLTLLIACAVIAAFCSRRNRRQKEASTYFDQGSMASTQHLAIPRPKV